MEVSWAASFSNRIYRVVQHIFPVWGSLFEVLAENWRGPKGPISLENGDVGVGDGASSLEGGRLYSNVL